MSRRRVEFNIGNEDEGSAFNKPTSRPRLEQPLTGILRTSSHPPVLVQAVPVVPDPPGTTICDDHYHNSNALPLHPRSCAGMLRADYMAASDEEDDSWWTPPTIEAPSSLETPSLEDSCTDDDNDDDSSVDTPPPPPPPYETCDSEATCASPLLNEAISYGRRVAAEPMARSPILVRATLVGVQDSATRLCENHVVANVTLPDLRTAGCMLTRDIAESYGCEGDDDFWPPPPPPPPYDLGNGIFSFQPPPSPPPYDEDDDFHRVPTPRQGHPPSSRLRVPALLPALSAKMRRLAQRRTRTTPHVHATVVPDDDDPQVIPYESDSNATSQPTGSNATSKPPDSNATLPSLLTGGGRMLDNDMPPPSGGDEEESMATIPISHCDPSRPSPPQGDNGPMQSALTETFWAAVLAAGELSSLPSDTATGKRKWPWKRVIILAAIIFMMIVSAVVGIVMATTSSSSSDDNPVGLVDEQVATLPPPASTPSAPPAATPSTPPMLGSTTAPEQGATAPTISPVVSMTTTFPTFHRFDDKDCPKAPPLRAPTSDGTVLAKYHVDWWATAEQGDCDDRAPVALTAQCLNAGRAVLFSAKDSCRVLSENQIYCENTPLTAVTMGCYGDTLQQLGMMLQIQNTGTTRCFRNSNVMVFWLHATCATSEQRSFTCAEGTLEGTIADSNRDDVPACYQESFCTGANCNLPHAPTRLFMLPVASCTEAFSTTRQAGELCFVDDNCQSNVCADGICRFAAGCAGDDCNVNEHCQSGKCDAKDSVCK